MVHELDDPFLTKPCLLGDPTRPQINPINDRDQSGQGEPMKPQVANRPRRLGGQPEPPTISGQKVGDLDLIDPLELLGKEAATSNQTAVVSLDRRPQAETRARPGARCTDRGHDGSRPDSSARTESDA